MTKIGQELDDKSVLPNEVKFIGVRTHFYEQVSQLKHRNKK